MKKQKVIFDCDIGCDDAVALISLLLNDDIDVEAITCVRGNIPVDDVCDNALKVTHLCNKEIPVYKGCSLALARTLTPGRDYNTLMQRIHMEIDGKEILIHDKSFNLPMPDQKVQAKHACSYLVDTLRNATEKYDICAIGPLTNIALALRMDPSIINNINTIYIMGGGLYIGNRTPVAEANFYDDPEAAEIVLNSGAHCVIAPIEACEMGGTYGPKELDDIKKTNNKVADFLVDELHGYIDRCNILFDCNLDDCCVYDYVAVAPLIDQSVITKMKREVVHVDVAGGMSDGQMVIDRRGYLDNKTNVDIIYEVDSDKIHSILIDELKRFA